MHQIHRRTPMLKCDFNKVAIEIILRHGCSPVNLLAAYFQNIFSQKHFCVATSGSSTYQKSLIRLQMHLKPKWKTFLQVPDGNTVNYYELLFFKHFLSSKNQENSQKLVRILILYSSDIGVYSCWQIGRFM